LTSGAAYLIAYFTMAALFGIPQMLLETGIGQYFRMSVVNTYAHVSRKFVGIGIMSVLCSFTVSIYYIYIMAYCLIYIAVAVSQPVLLHGTALVNSRRV
jgi:SNF family Na+-dependent transporter